MNNSSIRFQDWSSNTEMILKSLLSPNDPNLALGFLAKESGNISTASTNHNNNPTASTSSSSSSSSSSQLPPSFSTSLFENIASGANDSEIGPMLLAPLLSLLDSQLFQGFSSKATSSSPSSTIFGKALPDVTFLNDSAVCDLIDKYVDNNFSANKETASNEDPPLSVHSVIVALPFWLRPRSTPEQENTFNKTYSTSSSTKDDDEQQKIEQEFLLNSNTNISLDDPTTARDKILIKTLLRLVDAIKSIACGSASSSSSSPTETRTTALPDITVLRLSCWARQELPAICLKLSRLVLHIYLSQVLSHERWKQEVGALKKHHHPNNTSSTISATSTTTNLSDYFLTCNKTNRNFNFVILMILTKFLDLLNTLSREFNVTMTGSVEISRRPQQLKQKGDEQEEDTAAEENNLEQIEKEKNTHLLLQSTLKRILICVTKNGFLIKNNNNDNNNNNNSTTREYFLRQFLSFMKVVFLSSSSSSSKFTDLANDNLLIESTLKSILLSSLNISMSVSYLAFDCLFLWIERKSNNLREVENNNNNHHVAPLESVNDAKRFLEFVSVLQLDKNSGNKGKDQIIFFKVVSKMFNSLFFPSSQNNQQHQFQRSVLSKLLQDFVSFPTLPSSSIAENAISNDDANKNKTNNSNIPKNQRDKYILFHFHIVLCHVVLENIEHRGLFDFNITANNNTDQQQQQKSDNVSNATANKENNQNFVKSVWKNLTSLLVRSLNIQSYFSVSSSTIGDDSKISMQCFQQQQDLLFSLAQYFTQLFYASSETEFSASGNKNSWRLFSANLLRFVLDDIMKKKKPNVNSSSSNDSTVIIIAQFVKCFLLPLFAEANELSILANNNNDNTSLSPSPNHKRLIADATEVSIWLRDLLSSQISSYPSSCSETVDAVMTSILDQLLLSTFSSESTNSFCNIRCLIVAKELLQTSKIVLMEEDQIVVATNSNQDTKNNNSIRNCGVKLRPSVAKLFVGISRISWDDEKTPSSTATVILELLNSFVKGMLTPSSSLSRIAVLEDLIQFENLFLTGNRGVMKSFVALSLFSPSSKDSQENVPSLQTIASECYSNLCQFLMKKSDVFGKQTKEFCNAFQIFINELEKRRILRDASATAKSQEIQQSQQHQQLIQEQNNNNSNFADEIDEMDGFSGSFLPKLSQNNNNNSSSKTASTSSNNKSQKTQDVDDDDLLYFSISNGDYALSSISTGNAEFNLGVVVEEDLTRILQEQKRKCRVRNAMMSVITSPALVSQSATLTMNGIDTTTKKEQEISVINVEMVIRLVALLSRIHLSLSKNNSSISPPPFQKELIEDMYVGFYFSSPSTSNNWTHEYLDATDRKKLLITNQEVNKISEIKEIIERSLNLVKERWISVKNEISSFANNKKYQSQQSRNESSSASTTSFTVDSCLHVSFARVDQHQYDQQPSMFSLSFKNVSSSLSLLQPSNKINEEKSKQRVATSSDDDNENDDDDEQSDDETGNNDKKRSKNLREPYLITGIGWQFTSSNNNSSSGVISTDFFDFSTNPMRNGESMTVKIQINNENNNNNNETSLIFTLKVWFLATTPRYYSYHQNQNQSSNNRNTLLDNIKKIDQDQLPLVKGASRFEKVMEMCFGGARIVSNNGTNECESCQEGSSLESPISNQIPHGYFMACEKRTF